jgi:hypothetical protein
LFCFGWVVPPAADISKELFIAAGRYF